MKMICIFLWWFSTWLVDFTNQRFIISRVAWVYRY